MESGDGSHLKVAAELGTLVSESWTASSEELVAALGPLSPSMPNGSCKCKCWGELQSGVVSMTQCSGGEGRQTVTRHYLICSIKRNPGGMENLLKNSCKTKHHKVGILTD